MAINYKVTPWLMPGICAAIILIAFAVPRSDTPAAALSFLAFMALFCAVSWFAPIYEAPGVEKRQPLIILIIAVLSLVVALSWLPLQAVMAPNADRLGKLYDPSGESIEVIKLLGIGCAFFAGFRLSMNDDAAKRTLDVLLYTGAFWAVVAIIMYLADPDGIYGIQKMARGRLSGAFGSANSAGTLFGALTVLSAGQVMVRFFRSRSRSFLERLHLPMLAVLVLCFMALALTLSRGALAATFVSLAILSLVLLWRKVSPLWMAAGAIVTAVLIAGVFSAPLTAMLARFNEMDIETNTRGAIVKAHFDVARGQPWFGAGLGSFNTINGALTTASNYKTLALVRAAHNVYLQWFEEAGAVGLGALIFINLAILVPIARAATRREAMGPRLWMVLAAYLVFLLHGLTDYAFQEPALDMFVAVLLGCGLAIATNSARRSN